MTLPKRKLEGNLSLNNYFFSLPYYQKKGPFLWLATIEANKFHYEMETSSDKKKRLKPPSQWEWSQPTLLVGPRENMVGLVMFLVTNLSPTFYLSIVLKSFCHTSHHQNTIRVCVHLVYQENSYILFLVHYQLPDSDKSGWLCQQDSSWSTFGCWYFFLWRGVALSNQK